MSTPGEPDHGAVAPATAGALVFGASAAVLVVEIAALRLLAPYLGLTLETSTLVIGIALAAIATGAWAGGRAADVVPPRRVLGPLLGVSGVAVAALPFVVRGAGEAAGAAGALLVAMLAILVPGALLSAVPPMVTKLRLTDLAETGTVVGRLSGIGALGAIAGTVLTGFVFLAALPVSSVLVGVGVLLVLAGAAVELRVGGRRSAVLPVILLVPAGLGAAFGPGRCDVETVYHCADVRTDPQRDTGRLLVLDGLHHSYVDLADPTHLEFRYVRALASVTDATFPPGRALTAYHLGGGGLTFPRHLAATRPGTTSLVSEIDRGVLGLDVERLGLVTGPALEVRVEDARLGLRRVATDGHDLVVGDAFGGVSVPWHLATREALLDVRRVVRPDGVYAANLIDHAPLGFARAELATMREVFEHVAVAADPATLERAAGSGGNLVALGSDAPLDLAALTAGFAARDLAWEVIEGEDLDRWVGDASVLTDDHAPVDQLLTPYRAADAATGRSPGPAGGGAP
ncbi:MAG TPA: fused MFS/spermidine synthase [Dermatophilaceae bacterium]|nr:fused MFS/spermidine synthase [Dermatophilaceae bacterium]